MTSQAEAEALDYEPQDDPDGFSTSKDVQTGNWRCDVCAKLFAQRGTANRHALTHRGTDGCQFQCAVTACARSFITKASLKRHEATHSAARPFVCNHGSCRATFRTQDNLKQHMRSHDLERRFECDQCGHHSSTRQLLLKHQQTHRAHAAWRTCGIGCGRMFVTEEICIAHEQNCRGQPPDDPAFIHAPGALSTATRRIGQRILTRQTQNG